MSQQPPGPRTNQNPKPSFPYTLYVLLSKLLKGGYIGDHIGDYFKGY